MSRCEDSPEHKHMHKGVRHEELKEVHRDVRDMLKKTGADGTGYDGMICVISFFNIVPIQNLPPNQQLKYSRSAVETCRRCILLT